MLPEHCFRAESPLAREVLDDDGLAGDHRVARLRVRARGDGRLADETLAPADAGPQKEPARGDRLQERGEIGVERLRHGHARALEKAIQVRLGQGLLPEHHDGGLLAGPQPQGVVRFLQARDIHGEAEQDRPLSLFLPQADPRLKPDGAAVGREEAVSELRFGSVLQQLGSRGEDALPVLGVNQVGPVVRRGERLFPGVAEHLLRPAADEVHAHRRGVRFPDDAARDVLDQVPVPLPRRLRPASLLPLRLVEAGQPPRQRQRENHA